LGKDLRNIDEEGNDASWQHKRIEAADSQYKALPDKSKTERAQKAGESALSYMKNQLGL